LLVKAVANAAVVKREDVNNYLRAVVVDDDDDDDDDDGLESPQSSLSLDSWHCVMALVFL
jgi:hypothetical protein